MFGKPKAIVYLRRSSLELYSEKSQSSIEKLQIPTQLESSEEVLDQEGLLRFLNDFFTKVTAKEQKAVIILSDELTFSKVISLGQITKEELEAQKRQFIDNVPVGAHELSRLEVIYKDKLYLIACNKKLYEAVLKSLSVLGREVEFVVPAIIFGVSPGSPLTGADIHKIISGRELVKMSNLLIANATLDSDALGESTGSVQRKGNSAVFDMKYFFIPAFVIVVILVVIGGYVVLSEQKKINFGFINLKPFLGGATLKPSPLSSPISGPSADSQSLKLSDKGQMAVEVINGTGKAGQAGKVKTMLEKLGFADITIGNAQNSGNTVTKVEFAGDVSGDVVSEVLKELGTTFVKVESSQQSSDSGYKIIITTGPESNP